MQEQQHSETQLDPAELAQAVSGLDGSPVTTHVLDMAARPFLRHADVTQVRFHGQDFLVSRDTPEFRAAIQATQMLLKPRWPIPVPAPAKRRVSWAHFQSAYRNQGGRGTCWSFAAVAALEARYKRQHGLDLDLSEQYFFHLGRATGLRPDYFTTTQSAENASSFWGGGGNAGSVAALAQLWTAEDGLAPYTDQPVLTSLATAVRAGDLDAPDVDGQPTTQEQMDLLEWNEQHIPRAARTNARYGVKAAQAIGYDLATLESWISSGHEVTLDVDVKWRWDAGFDGYVRDDAASGGWHVVLLIGFDQDQQAFLIKNSWGEGRPVHLSYDFVVNHAGGAAVITDVHPVGDADRRHAWLGRWHMDHDGWRGDLVVRRWADATTPTKLGNYYREDGTRLDVNGFMAQTGLRMSFTIAPTPGRKQPGVMDGQRFDVYNFSWEPSLAAGLTTWNGVPFGVQLSRDPLPAFQRDTFDPNDWVGQWDMVHDGWHGVLSIRSVQKVDLPFLSVTVLDGGYRAADGRDHAVVGVLTGGREHELSLTVDFDGTKQPFRLLHHTWERGTFSGTTDWGGMTFGAVGRRR